MTWSDDIDRAGARTVAVSWSLRDDRDVVGDVSALLARAAVAAARDGLEALTLDELTLAAVCSSEDGHGTAQEIAALCDATMNRSAGRSIYETATAGLGFGRAGAVGSDYRPMSTARRPELRHIRAAVAVTRGAARGCARGARAWFHWRTQARLSAVNPLKHCPPVVILERWAYNCPWANRAACTLGPRRAPTLEWIGQVPGIDAGKVIMMRPATAAHAERFASARAIILGGRATDLLTSALAVLAVGVALGGSGA